LASRRSSRQGRRGGQLGRHTGRDLPKKALNLALLGLGNEEKGSGRFGKRAHRREQKPHLLVREKEKKKSRQQVGNTLASTGANRAHPDNRRKPAGHGIQRIIKRGDSSSVLEQWERESTTALSGNKGKGFFTQTGKDCYIALEEAKRYQNINY